MAALHAGTSASERAASFVDGLMVDLQAHADSERAVKERAYLKSERDHLGVAVPQVRRSLRARVRADPPSDRDELLARAQVAWSLGVHEACLAACEMLADAAAMLDPADLERVERWIREARTWALVDVLAPRVVGSLIERDPELDDVLARWTGDADAWLRRASLLAYLLPLRRGDDVFARYARHADVLLEDDSFWVRKALGWTLRERAKRRPDQVVAWLAPRLERASKLTVREATRTLPDPARERLARESSA